MRILIVIIISVTLSAFQPNQNNNQDSQITDSVQRDVVNQMDLKQQQINIQQKPLEEFNEILQNHQEDNIQYANQNEFIHSVQYWLDILDNDQLSQDQSSENNLAKVQQPSELQTNQFDSSTHQSRLAKYIQIQSVELQQPSDTLETTQQNTIPKLEEKNPLKLFLLYSDNVKQQNNEDDQHQIYITNEQILDQLEKEKQDKISKMQSLIIEQLKDKKPEPKKEESFLEKDYIEWEMKTLINNNNLRSK